MRSFPIFVALCLLILAVSNDAIPIDATSSSSRNFGEARRFACPGCCTVGMNHRFQQICRCPDECQCRSPNYCTCPLMCGCELDSNENENCVGKK